MSLIERIRAVTAEIPNPTPLPEYDPSILLSAPRLDGPADLWELFSRNFTAVHGRAMSDISEVASFLAENGHTHGYCDPELAPALLPALQQAGLTVETEYDRSRYDDYRFGITRASGAIAESGSLILDDLSTSRRLAALSPWVHIAALRPQDIHRSIPDAVAALAGKPNVIWVTGPSKTADVEGILIEGVHGPGEQIALRL